MGAWFDHSRFTAGTPYSNHPLIYSRMHICALLQHQLCGFRPGLWQLQLKQHKVIYDFYQPLLIQEVIAWTAVEVFSSYTNLCPCLILDTHPSSPFNYGACNWHRTIKSYFHSGNEKARDLRTRGNLWVIGTDQPIKPLQMHIMVILCKGGSKILHLYGLISSNRKILNNISIKPHDEGSCSSACV